MANNIISAVFSSSNITYTKPAYQYDYGMILKFSGIELPQAYEVHFSNTEFCGESISQIGDESGVTIPDEMFLSGNPIYAWTFLHTGEDDGETVYKTVISINKRAQPSDIEPTPVQQDVITQAIAALNTAVEQTAADVVAAGESAEAAAGSAEAAGQAKDDAVEAKDKAVEAKNAAETAQGKAEDAQRAAEQAAGSVLGLTADATVDANVGTPSVSVSVTTESDHKKMSFAFHNLKGMQGDTGVGISSVVLNADYTLTITLTNGTSYTTSSIRGDVGATPNLTIGTVSTLPEGSQATATITGTDEEPVLNLGIPVGDTGDPGISPTITVTEITGGHEVEVVDAEGTQTFNVMDGLDGQSGLITDYIAEDKTPYLFRPSASGLANVISEKPTIVGGTVVWNQLWDETMIPSDSAIYSVSTYTANNVTFTKNGDGSITIQTTAEGASAKTQIKIGNASTLGQLSFRNLICGSYGGSASTYCINHSSSDTYDAKFRDGSASGFNMWVIVQSGAIITTPVKIYPQIFNLDKMFGTTISSYLLTLGDANGFAWFRKLFPKLVYPRNTGELMSVQTSAHVMRDADDNVIGNYPLDSDLVLRGVLKLDASNNLYYEGDVYESDGTVTRNYQQRAYQSGDESLADAITDGTNTVVKLVTPTTEQADPYSEYQVVDAYGTEEYVDERTVPIPVGHDTFYQQAVDVTQLPTTDGAYRLALSLTGNTATASWEYVAQAEMKAQTNIPSGKYFSVGERLFVSTQAIAQGASIVVGTNCLETTLADALNQINA